MQLQDHTHKRYNILSGEWLLVSPHRTKRPWQGKVDKPQRDIKKRYDPECYLCPGNKRAGGLINPDYTDTFSFINDYSALIPDIPAGEYNKGNLLMAKTERGICKVICFSPRHDLTLARMSNREITGIIDLWIDEYEEFRKLDGIRYVQIFENRGAIMGCSNPHPHGQIWANEDIPDLPYRESASQQDYLRKYGRCLLCDYLELEKKEKERIVFENESFTVLVPFWAVWPFEVMILPNEHLSSISGLNARQKDHLSDAMRRTGIRYDNLFSTDFPYSMGIHQMPADGKQHQEWHFHLHYFPPLLRSASVRKFMVGYELLAMAQRDLTAERCASMLRELSDLHYRDS